MRGRKDFNFPAFDKVREYLRQEFGWEVFCPAEHDRNGGFDETKGTLDGFSLSKAFEWDVRSILKAHAIVLLPGWKKSSGATTEYMVAKLTGKGVYTVSVQKGGKICLKKNESLMK